MLTRSSLLRQQQLLEGQLCVQPQGRILSITLLGILSIALLFLFAGKVL